MKPIVLIILVLVWTVVVHTLGFNAGRGGVAQGSASVTSQDVWSEVNAYRQSRGFAPMEVYTPLCDNLVERYHAIADTNRHDGFVEFITAQQARGVLPTGNTYYEVFASGATARETVNAWRGSMGHEIAITSHPKGCAYTHAGLSIILMTD